MEEDSGLKNLASLTFNTADAEKKLQALLQTLNTTANLSEKAFKEMSNNFQKMFANTNIDLSSFSDAQKKIIVNEQIALAQRETNNQKSANTLAEIDARKNAKIEIQNNALKNRLESSTKSSLANMAKTYLTYNGFNILRQSAMELIETMKDVEYRMMEISRIMEEGTINVNEYRDSLTQLAYDYGRAFDEVSGVTLNFARAGFDANESLALTEKSLLALNTAELDAEEATDGLISVMAQWGMDTGTAAEQAENLGSVIDKINKVADNFPTTSADLLDALKRTSQGFNLAGASIDETIALLVAAERSAQRGGKVIGTALANIVQQLKTEGRLNIAEELGLNFFEDDAKTIYKDVTDIFIEMSEKMQQLKEDGKGSSTEMQQLLELFTVFRRNIGAGLLSEMEGEDSTYMQALETSMNSLGYSAQENSKYMSTMEAATQQFNAQILQLINTLTDEGGRDIFGVMIAGGSQFISVLNKMIDTFGAFPTAIAVATTAMSAFQKQSSADKLKGFINELDNIKKAISMYNNEVKSGVLTQEQFSDIVGKHTSKSFTEYTSNLGDGTAKLSQYATKTIAAKAGQLALNAVLNIAKGLFAMAITAAIQVAIEALVSYINRVQEAGEALKEANEQLTESTTKLNDYAAKVKTLREELKDETISQESAISKRKELLQIQKELIELYGDEADGIDLVTGSIESQTEAIDKLGKSEYKKYIRENEKEINTLASNLNKNISKTIYFDATTFKTTGTKLDIQKILSDIGELESKGTIKITGTAEEIIQKYNEAYDALDKYRRKLSDEAEINYATSMIESISSQLSKLNKEYSDSIEEYKEYLNNRLMYDELYSKKYGEILAARSALSEAEASGDESAIKAARDKLENVLNGAIELTKKDGVLGEGIKDIIQDELANLQKDEFIAELKIRLAKGPFKEAAQDLEKIGYDTAEEFAQGLEDGFEGVDLNQNMKALIKLFELSELSAEDFVKVLINIKSVSFPETVKEINTSLDTLKQNFSDSIDALASLEDKFVTCYNAMNEFNQNGYMSAATLDSLIDNDLLKYFDILNGKIVLNETAMANDANVIRANAVEKLKNKTAAELLTIAEGTLKQSEDDSTASSAKLTQQQIAVKNALANLTPEVISSAEAFNQWWSSVEGSGVDTSTISEKIRTQMQTAIQSFQNGMSFINNYSATTVAYSRSSYGSGSSGGSSSTRDYAAEQAEKEAEEAAKKAEELRKEALEGFKDDIEERERLEDRWVKNKKQLGKITAEDEKYILQESIKRYKTYADEVSKLTFATEEEKQELRKKYLEEAEDLALEYFETLQDILDDEIDAIEDKYDSIAEHAEDMYDKRISKIEEEAEAEIAALNKVQDEKDRLTQKEEYEAQRKELISGNQGVEYWEQRTGREAQLALAEAKKKVEELDKEWEDTVEEWNIEDKIEDIEKERDARIQAIEMEREDYLKSLEIKKDKEIKALEEKYQYEVDYFNKTGEIIQNNATIQSKELFNTYKKNFIDPVGTELQKALDSQKKTETKQNKTTSTTKYTDYKIVSGDTLSGIASRFGTTVQKILDANPYVTDPNLIYAGKTLKIPSSHTGSKILKDGLVNLQAGETVLNMNWAKGLDRMLGQFNNQNSGNTINNGNSIKVEGDLLKVEAKIEDKTDMAYLTKKIYKRLENKFDIKA